MQSGQWALTFTILTVAIIPFIKLAVDRSGIQLTRRTEIDKMYLSELNAVRAENRDLRAANQALTDRVQTLREQHLVDLEDRLDTARRGTADAQFREPGDPDADRPEGMGLK